VTWYSVGDIATIEGFTEFGDLRLVGSASTKSGKGEETVSAKLMAVPFGQVLVALVGVAVLAVGIAQIVKGIKQSFVEDRRQSEWPARRAQDRRLLGQSK
jgi:hypothetical protein